MSSNAAEVRQFSRLHAQAVGLAADIAPLDITTPLGYPYVTHRVTVEAIDRPPTIIETERRFVKIAGATLVDRVVTRFLLQPAEEGGEPSVAILQETQTQRRPVRDETPKKVWGRTDESPLRGMSRGRALYRLQVGLDALITGQDRVIDAERSPLSHMNPEL